MLPQNLDSAGPSAVIRQRRSERCSRLESDSSSVHSKQRPPFIARGARGRASHTASSAASVTPAVPRIPWSLVCRVPRGGASDPSSSSGSESGDGEDGAEAGVDAEVGGVAGMAEKGDTSGEESEVCAYVFAGSRVLVGLLWWPFWRRCYCCCSCCCCKYTADGMTL